MLEEGSKTAHVTIVARAIGIPMVGRIEGVMDALDPGNPVALDGDNGHVYVRPNDEILQAFHNAVRARAERRRYFDQIRDAAVGYRRTASRSPCRSTPPS